MYSKIFSKSGHEKTKPLPYNVDALEMKMRLQELASIGEVEVNRSKCSPVGGCTWTISFLDDLKGTNRGDMEEFTIISNLYSGSDLKPSIEVKEVQKGTFKEVQKISVLAGGLLVNPLTHFKLEFEGQITGDIQAAPLDGTSCLGSTLAKQVISTSTEDTSSIGGDNTVSRLTMFTIIYKGFETIPIHANIGNCTKTASTIKEELLLIPYFHEVQVFSKQSDKDDEGCEWEVIILSITGTPESFQGTI
jgi:hypothetical protein